MHNFALAVAATLASVGLVSAHGYVPEIKISGKSYPGYNPYIDPFDPSASPKIFRKILWNGPTEDVTSKDLQCGGRSGSGTNPAPLHAPAEAGSNIELYWTAWPDSHHGPVITYMAKCPGKCDDYQPGSEKVWFKIHEDGKRPDGTWGSDEFITTGKPFNITIPRSLESGNYIVRHEIIALHFAFQYPGAQLYPSCFQLTVTGSGNATGPAEKVAFPGAYSGKDPGIAYDLYLGPVEYPIPGPEVWSS